MSSRNLTGQTIAQYHLHQRIGKGGFGSIYQATNTYDQSVVAIKTLHQHMQEDEDVVERFQREARSLASLQHPNIVQLLDFGWDDEVGHFMVLEWLPGRSLKAHLKEHKKLSFGEVFGLFEQLLAGLGDAHNQGIVHRDLKPANLFLVPTGGSLPRLKILDFGLALLSFELMRRTQKGSVMGSSNYMAPEQAMGQIELIDVTTDLYACGCLLAKCLTGRTPFRGNAYEVAMKHYNQEPLPSLKQLQPFIEYPEAIEQVYRQAVSRPKEERFSSPWEFYQAMLDAFGPYMQEQAAAEPNLLQTFVASDPQAMIEQLSHIGHVTNNPRDLGFAPTPDEAFPAVQRTDSLDLELNSAFERNTNGFDHTFDGGEGDSDDVMSFSFQQQSALSSTAYQYQNNDYDSGHSGHSGHGSHSNSESNSYSGHSSSDSGHSNSFAPEAFAQTSMFPEGGEELLAQYTAANQPGAASGSGGGGVPFTAAVASAKTIMAPETQGKARVAEVHFTSPSSEALSRTPQGRGSSSNMNSASESQRALLRDDLRSAKPKRATPQFDEDDSESSSSSSSSSGISLMRKRPIPASTKEPQKPDPRDRSPIRMSGARIKPQRKPLPVALLAGGGAVLIGAIVFLILIFTR